MLVLTRKEGEMILLGEEIEVRVLRVDGDQVRIGIVAPRSVNVVRGELLEQIRGETAAAAVPEAAQVKALSMLLRAKVAPVTADK